MGGTVQLTLREVVVDGAEHLGGNRLCAGIHKPVEVDVAVENAILFHNGVEGHRVHLQLHGIAAIAIV